MSKIIKTETVSITAPNLLIAEFEIEGTAPYVQNAFPEKVRHQMQAKQEAGSQSGSKKKRDAKDFNECYENAKHKSEEGWLGIPATSFRGAMISACRLIDFKMTRAKLSVFVVADGYEANGQPLVKIKGEPMRHDSYVRNETGVPDIRPRPMWRTWSATLRIQYDADQFSLTDVTNLLMRAGMQVGIGEGRPDSKKSLTGMGWGTFAIKKDVS